MYLVNYQNKKDAVLAVMLKTAAVFSALIALIIFVFLLKESALVLFKINIFSHTSWNPELGQFSLVPMILGSLLISLGALFISFPVALFFTLFINFYSPKFISKISLFLLKIFYGIPSVLFGLFGLMFLVPFIYKFHPPGQSVLAGMLLLMLMIFPIFTLSINAAINESSNLLKINSVNLGFSKSTYIWKVLLPNLKKQILSSSLLMLTRAIGETMAIVMVCGNLIKIPNGIFDQARTLTSHIALEMAYATGDHRSALFASGLVLMTIVGCLVFFSQMLRTKHGE